MALLDELEASLRAKWDRDTLAVYADHLQSLGELRGELIVVDLRIEEAGPLPELVARRKELLAAWLRTLPPGKVQHGFLDVDATGADPVGQVRTAFASPAAPYIRTIAIVGPPKLVRDALAIVAAAERPALVRIVVRQWNEAGVATLVDPSKLFAATPNLHTLEVDGYRILGGAHRAVRHLRISGWDAVTLAHWSSLEELDFAFASHVGSTHTEPTRNVLASLPALRTLDLSRNHPGKLDPDTLGGAVNVFAALRQVSCASLRVLRLPKVETAAQLADLRIALAQLPDLERLEIRDCRQRDRIEHPRVTFF